MKIPVNELTSNRHKLSQKDGGRNRGTDTKSATKCNTLR